MSKKKKKEPLILTAAELLEYERASEALKYMNLEMSAIHLEQKLYASEKENADLKIKLATRDAGDKARKIKEFKKSHIEFNNQVCKRLGFKEGTRFAYDPQTGDVDEIKEES